ncbi:leucyl/phenylalanyl-tRNA--protein transferase [Ruegeria sp. WL0004]|uniref:Leucyl/phenylalanyl-tRNA--protein transferase n=1 Tax=Ruegeria marisflavi TaxID=2984152 RepID=A0ABT2WTV3_9RHOB|nr:leucyl/phenylalanyl-tRNA--protein transferase [Ruegeria sp. WL0004]MCU9839328.1 leucyl/phenylalanyl-tRNA--protein transferase [Ruegeria sp. WL0004]
MTLSPELLLHGYSIGIFPMAEHRNDPEVFWVDPLRRGIFPLDGFHLSRSLVRRIRRGEYHVTFDHDFAGVLQGCADRAETWINPEISDSYQALHRLGHAHSVEVWQGSTLAGGVYGVVLGAAFFGESMFSRRTDASKVALVYLIDRLRQTGFQLFDTQFLTAHLASLGAVAITRAEYRRRLEKALNGSADIAASVDQRPQDVIQRMTQTS